LKTGEAKTISSKKNLNSDWRKNIRQTYCKKMGQQINEGQIFKEHYLGHIISIFQFKRNDYL
jgi:hypothetical protein